VGVGVGELLFVNEVTPTLLGRAPGSRETVERVLGRYG
jgi:hypothetical protein